METLLIILIFIAGWLSTLSGVALGGWLVYRTKRDPYDPLFSSNTKGMSFNIDDDLGMGDTGGPDKQGLPKPTEAANDIFMKQFADKLVGKAGNK